MPKIAYINKNFGADSLEMIERANEIIEEYQAAGYTLTLRQLYYQFVSRDLISNTVQSYKRLGGIVADGRDAGLIDWDAIEDRTRNLASPATWESPGEIVEACARQFKMDLWAGQKWRPEVWVEKEALAGVVQVACQPLRVPYFSCRGYVSASEIWAAARRLAGYTEVRPVSPDGETYSEIPQRPIVIHLGDHDPSGIDMSRDIIDRLEKYAGQPIKVVRIALNIDQVRRYNPPANPAKATDARFSGYQERYGDESWELDALDPQVMTALIRSEVEKRIVQDRWDDWRKAEEEGRRKLEEVAETL
jgi:hypothetical protein